MKKTLIALMALAGVANAGWYTGSDANLYEVTGNVDTVTTMNDSQNVNSDYQLKALKLDGVSNQDRQATIGEYILRGGKKVVVMDRWQDDSTNLDLTINKLTITSVTTGEGDSATTADTGNVTVNAGQKLTINGINGNLATLEIAGGTFTAGGSLAMGTLKTSTAASTVNFADSGAIATSAQMSMSLGAALTFGAELSLAEQSSLSAGDMVTRTLLSTDKLNGVTLATLDEKITLSLTGADINYAGVVYSVTTNGVTTYHNIDDVSLNGNNYATVDRSTAIELEKGYSYIVVGAIGYADASMKTISFVASIPEPATATLSLLALCGLAARRRRA